MARLAYGSMADKPKETAKTDAESGKTDAPTKKDDAPEPAAVKEEAKAEAKPEKPGAKHGEARAAMLKSHMAERRDVNGRHRDEIKQLHARHEEAIEAMAKAHDIELTPAAADDAPAAAAPTEEANVEAGNEAP